MKTRKKISARLLAIMLIAALLLPLAWNVPVEAAEAKQIDVLFSHDTHSHLNSFSTIVDGEQKDVGGFARIKTLIDEKKQEDPDTLVLDGGDFSMGTLIQTVYETEAAELRMLGYLGYDVTTLGNHEYDYRSKGLANMLEAAKASGETVPALVVCNVDWDSMEQDGLSDGQKQIRSAFEAYGVKDYVVVQKGDVKAAVVGVFGKDALECAPTCELKFKDPVEAVKQTVEEIRKNEKVDMIACVSHGGTWEDENKSEDEILAKEVPDIDLIISGHTHTELKEAIQHGNTYIVSCGEYGRNLGSLSMTQKQDGRWELTSYELIPVSEDVKPDQATQEQIDALMDTVDKNYLADFGYTREEVLAENDVEFNSLEEMGTKHEELNLGDIMSDAYIYAVENSEYYDGDPVDVAVVPSGTVRDTYTKGDITVEDVFNSFSLGIGKDGVAGYPLISAYLTGKELKLAAEVDASVSDFMNRYKGVGMAKAASIIAAMELGRRRALSTAREEPALTTSRDLYDYLQPLIGDLDHEEFWVVTLSSACRIKSCDRLFSGGIESTIIDIRMIFRKVLESKACSIVIAHNHPSGNDRPSSHDITLTKKVQEAGRVLDITLLDHIVVCPNRYYSFADNGML